MSLFKTKNHAACSFFRVDDETNTWVDLGVFAHNVGRFARFVMQTARHYQADEGWTSCPPTGGDSRTDHGKFGFSEATT